MKQMGTGAMFITERPRLAAMLLTTGLISAAVSPAPLS
jgi:hypothetical protein